MNARAAVAVVHAIEGPGRIENGPLPRPQGGRRAWWPRAARSVLCLAAAVRGRVGTY
jgi:hypothetical protein